MECDATAAACANATSLPLPSLTPCLPDAFLAARPPVAVYRLHDFASAGAALLTGRLGLRNGVTTNFHIDSTGGLPRTEITIAELLKPAGIAAPRPGNGTSAHRRASRRTAASIGTWPAVFGRYGLYGPGRLRPAAPRRCALPGPTPHQWVLPLPLYHSNSSNCSGLPAANATGGNSTCNGDIVEAPVNLDTLSDRYAAFATEFIHNATIDARPFFLYVPFSHVHTPQYVSPRGAGRSGKPGDAGHFYDALLELDGTVGKIMSALTEAGVDNNTLVFVSGYRAVETSATSPVQWGPSPVCGRSARVAAGARRRRR